MQLRVNFAPDSTWRKLLLSDYVFSPVQSSVKQASNADLAKELQM